MVHALIVVKKLHPSVLTILLKVSASFESVAPGQLGSMRCCIHSLPLV